MKIKLLRLNKKYRKRNNRKIINELNINNELNISYGDINVSYGDINNTPKICIIYVYYERKNQQKNQTNLSFFIKYGLDKSRWRDMDITTLLVINGHQCEVLIPKRNDLFVLKQDNCSDWEGWYDGIKYLENKYNKPIYQQFSHLCLINASSFGPVYEDASNKHWLDPFFDKMKEENSVICCPCSNMLPDSDWGGPGRRLSPIFSLIKIDKLVMDLLINTKIYSFSNGTKHGWYNTIIGKKTGFYRHKAKIDAILTGEYGLSRILLNNHYKISSLVIGNTNIRIDFYNTNNDNLKNSVFIKNIWRLEDNYASQPVLYKYCIDFMNRKLNYINEFENYSSYNYNTLNKNSGKMIISYMLPLSYGDTTFWNDNKSFYNKFSYAEEPIIFPRKINNKHCVIYAHYDTDNILKDYVINSLKILMILNYDIIFYTSATKILNIDLKMLPFDINYIKNIGPGTDWYIWLDGLKKCEKYDRILLVNDSLILGINGIENMKKSINKIRNKNFDLWGHWSSSDLTYHYVGTPIEIKKNLRNELILFIEENLPKCNSGMDFIINIETKMIQYFKNKGYSTGVIFEEEYILRNISNLTVRGRRLLFNRLVRRRGAALHNYVCPSHNPALLRFWIYNKNAFAIKWKYVLPYLLFKNIVNPFFNYQLKYLHTSEYNLFINKCESSGVFPEQNYFKKCNRFQSGNYT